MMRHVPADPFRPLVVVAVNQGRGRPDQLDVPVRHRVQVERHPPGLVILGGWVGVAALFGHAPQPAGRHRFVGRNIANLQDLGDVSYDLARPILRQVTNPEQLRSLELAWDHRDPADRVQ